MPAREQSLERSDAALAALPPGRRDEVRKDLRGLGPVVREHAQAVQRLRGDLGRELARPQLDSAAIDRDFANIEAQTTATQAEPERRFKRALEMLTPEERRAVIEALSRRAPPVPGLG